MEYEQHGYPQQYVHPTVIRQQYDAYNVWKFENEWRTDLLSCQPTDRCCIGCFCPCWMGYQLATYTGEMPMIGCLPCSITYLRTKLRTARRIEGSCYEDCFATMCCTACVATQMSNELDDQGLWEQKKETRRR